MKTAQPGVSSAHAAMSFAALTYGVNYFTMKWIFIGKKIHPLGLLSLRSICATFCFFIFYLLFIREGIRSWEDFGRLILCAITGIIVNQAMFIYGVSETTEVNAAVLQILSPIFVFICAFVIGQEKFSKLKIAGLVLSLSSAVLLTMANKGGGLRFNADTIDGDIMIIINAAFYGVYLVIVKPLLSKYNFITLLAWQFLLGSLINIPLGWGYLMEARFEEFDTFQIFGLVYFIIVCTILAYIVYTWALKKLEASSVAMYIYFQPVFVTLVSVFLPNGSLNLLKVFFIFLVFAGVYLVISKKFPWQKSNTGE